MKRKSFIAALLAIPAALTTASSKDASEAGNSPTTTKNSTGEASAAKPQTITAQQAIEEMRKGNFVKPTHDTETVFFFYAGTQTTHNNQITKIEAGMLAAFNNTQMLDAITKTAAFNPENRFIIVKPQNELRIHIQSVLNQQPKYINT